ncbi:MAG: NAD-binding oxidoreductase [Alphaproteobacteria bacterium]|nr:NAD-binding oxidoreductase [Alphaproteobacteria bacterium]
MSFHDVTVVENRLVADDHHHLTLDPGHPDLLGGYTIPGQFVQLRLGEDKPGFFAIASAPGQDTLEFLVQRGGGVSAALCALEPGATVAMSAPMGKGFDVTRLAGRDALLFATGSGISAVRSVIESRSWGGHRATLFYGARTPARMAWQDHFDDWRARGLTVVPVISRPEGTGWTGKTGYVQHAYRDAPYPTVNDAVAVLCGVKGMVEEITAMLIGAGLHEDHVLMNY